MPLPAGGSLLGWTARCLDEVQQAVAPGAVAGFVGVEAVVEEVCALLACGGFEGGG